MALWDFSCKFIELWVALILGKLVSFLCVKKKHAIVPSGVTEIYLTP